MFRSVDELTGRQIRVGLDKDASLILSIVIAAANVHVLSPGAVLLHSQEDVVFADTGYRGIENRPVMKGKADEFLVAIRTGKPQTLPDTPYGRVQDFVDTDKVHILSKGEHLFRVIKQQFGFQ